MEIQFDFILYICSIITSVAAAATIISKTLKKAITKATQDTIKKEVANLQKSFDGQLEELNNKLKEYQKSNDKTDVLVKKALLGIIRDRINQAHDMYVEKEFIGAHSLFVIEELYASYKSLGGNSFIDHQMDDIRELTVESAETVLHHENV